MVLLRKVVVVVVGELLEVSKRKGNIQDGKEEQGDFIPTEICKWKVLGKDGVS